MLCLISLHSLPYNDNVTRRKLNLKNVCICIKKAKLNGLIGSALEIYLRCLAFGERFLHLEWSPPVVNYIDWTWLERHTPLFRNPHSWQCILCQKLKTTGSKEPPEAQKQDYCKAQILFALLLAIWHAYLAFKCQIITLLKFNLTCCHGRTVLYSQSCLLVIFIGVKTTLKLF